MGKLKGCAQSHMISDKLKKKETCDLKPYWGHFFFAPHHWNMEMSDLFSLILVPVEAAR